MNRFEDCKRRTAAMANFTMVEDLERALAVVEAVLDPGPDYAPCPICGQRPIHRAACPLDWWLQEASNE